jgi:hypothetical protein
MDKKTKMWLGVGVVGVGAYLLMKSKKSATPSLTTAATEPAKTSFAAQDGSFYSSERMKNQTGIINDLNSPTTKFNQTGMINTLDSERMKNQTGSGFFDHQRQISANGLNGNSFDVQGARAGSQNAGIFANTPFVNKPANLVGATGDQVFASQDGTGKFFAPRTAKYGQNQGVFAPSKPKIKTPVEPAMPAIPVKQSAPLNNLVGQDGSRFFSVHDGFGK